MRMAAAIKTIKRRLDNLRLRAERVQREAERAEQTGAPRPTPNHHEAAEAAALTVALLVMEDPKCVCKPRQPPASHCRVHGAAVMHARIEDMRAAERAVLVYLRDRVPDPEIADGVAILLGLNGRERREVQDLDGGGQ